MNLFHSNLYVSIFHFFIDEKLHENNTYIINIVLYTVSFYTIGYMTYYFTISVQHFNRKFSNPHLAVFRKGQAPYVTLHRIRHSHFHRARDSTKNRGNSVRKRTNNFFAKPSERKKLRLQRKKKRIIVKDNSFCAMDSLKKKKYSLS